MTCIITGVKVIDAMQNRAAVGDLHVIGECYVAVCNVSRDGYVNWSYGSDANLIIYKRHVTLTGYYLEKRGVIIASVIDVDLNDEAQEYIG